MISVVRPGAQGRRCGSLHGTVSLEADSIAGLFDTLEQHPQIDLLLLDLNLPGRKRLLRPGAFARFPSGIAGDHGLCNG